MGRILRRGLRKSCAQLAVLALVTGGALAAFTVSASATKPSCDDSVESAYKHHFVLMCKEGPETAVAGTDITYTLTTFSSTHKSDEHLFQVEDDLPTGTSLVDVDGGEAWDCSGSTSSTVFCTHEGDGSEIDEAEITVTAHVDSGFDDEGIENCATLSIDPMTDEAATEDYGVDPSTDCADTEITREFDVSIQKTGPASLVVPNNITYTITASNAGPSDSDPVSFTDTLPAGTTLVNVNEGTDWDCSSTATAVECETFDGIPAGESVSATITLSVPLAHAGTTLENCATLTTSEDEVEAGAVTQSCATIAGANVTVKAAEAVTGLAPRFTG